MGNVVTLQTGSADPSTEVREVVIHDPREPVDVHTDDLILGVGIDPAGKDFLELCSQYAAAGASAILVKGPTPSSWLKEPDLPVLEAPKAMEWGSMLTLLRAAVGVVGGTASLGGQPGDVENLFALCDVLASRGGGPVVLHDPQWRMLAYSSGGFDLDDIGRATILDRRAPRPWLERVRADAKMGGMLAGEVLHLEGAANPRLPTRSAIAIRAGAELLGSLWLLHGKTAAEDLTKLETTMREIADIAALQMLRSRVFSSVAIRREEELLAGLFSGAVATPLIAERLNIPPHTPLLVAGFRPICGNRLDEAVSLERLSATLRVVCDAYRLRSRLCVLDDTAYVLVLLQSADARRTAVKVLREVHGQVTSAVESVHAGAGQAVEALGDLHASQSEVRILLDLQAEGKLPPDRLADVEENKVAMEYARLRRVFRDHPLGPEFLQPLLEGGSDGDRTLIETTKAYFEGGGDVQSASKALDIHPNTVRYRIRRLREVYGLDLEDPSLRFLVELYIRLLA